MAKFITKLEHGVCRDLGHAWKPGPIKVSGGFIDRTLVCMHDCGTSRIESLSYRTGEIIARHYVYEQGYQLQGLDARPSRAQLRADYLDLLLSKGRKVVDITDRKGARR